VHHAISARATLRFTQVGLATPGWESMRTEITSARCTHANKPLCKTLPEFKDFGAVKPAQSTRPAGPSTKNAQLRRASDVLTTSDVQGTE